MIDKLCISFCVFLFWNNIVWDIKFICGGKGVGMVFEVVEVVIYVLCFKYVRCFIKNFVDRIVNFKVGISLVVVFRVFKLVIW